jgi:hypothetical protein
MTSVDASEGFLLQATPLWVTGNFDRRKNPQSITRRVAAASFSIFTLFCELNFPCA